MAPGAATWRAEAVVGDDDPRVAFERCSARLNALVERLAAVGEVETEAVVVQPRFRRQRPEAVGAVRVRCPAERAGEVAQAAMAAGADRLHGPRFEYGEQEAIKLELLGEAFAVARSKAERLAAAAERRLGAVVKIDERRDEAYEPVEMMAAGQPDVPDVRPREQTVTATVTVSFAFDD